MSLPLSLSLSLCLYLSPFISLCRQSFFRCKQNSLPVICSPPSPPFHLYVRLSVHPSIRNSGERTAVALLFQQIYIFCVRPQRTARGPKRSEWKKREREQEGETEIHSRSGVGGGQSGVKQKKKKKEKGKNGRGWTIKRHVRPGRLMVGGFH